MKFEFDKKVDAKGLKCPQPLLLAKQAFKDMEIDQVLLLEATDPHTDLDLEVWCERFAHEIQLSIEEEQVFYFLIQKRQ
jgi:tRNA 2-thiouridine synthesizing protein A